MRIVTRQKSESRLWIPKIKPVIHEVFELEAAARAHELMESSQHIGKIVLTVS